MREDFIQTCKDYNNRDVEFNEYNIEEIRKHINVNFRYNQKENKVFLCLYHESPMSNDIEKSSKTILQYDNKLFFLYKTYYIEYKVVFVFYANQKLYYEDGEWKIED